MRSRQVMTRGSWATRPTSRSNGRAPGCTARRATSLAIACSPRSCSPISSTRRPSWPGWAMRHGAGCSSSTTFGCALSSISFAVARSRRRATGSWPCSTRPCGPSGARQPWDRLSQTSGSGSEPACIPVRSSSAAGNPRGVAVHAAARIAALAGPDEVLVSATTRDLLEGSGLAFEDRGEHELKGLSTPRHVFALARTIRTRPLA